jgi:hypothetical protein
MWESREGERKMPNGIFPRPNVRTTPNPGPHWAHRTWLFTRLRRNALDRQLAAGARSGDSPALSLRAAQLRSNPVRERLAAAITAAVADARTGAPANVEHPQRGATRDCADELMALAARLRSHQPVDARGAAMVALLVNDTLHRTGRDQLRDAVAEAHAALIPAHDADLQVAA